MFYDDECRDEIQRFKERWEAKLEYDAIFESKFQVSCSLKKIRRMNSSYSERQLVIIYCLEGEISVKTGVFEGILKADELLLIPCRHIYEASAEKDNKTLIIHIDGQDNFADQACLYSMASEDSRVENLKDRLLVYAYLCYRDRVIDDEIFLALGSELQQLVTGIFAPQKRVPNEDCFCGIAQYVLRNYNENLSVSQFEQKYSLSSRYMASLFRKAGFRHFSGFVSHVRCFEADLLLYDTDLPVREIAVQCGFSSVNYFVKVFKAFFGVTPLRRRQAHRQSKSGLAHMTDCGDSVTAETVRSHLGMRHINNVLSEKYAMLNKSAQ